MSDEAKATAINWQAVEAVDKFRTNMFYKAPEQRVTISYGLPRAVVDAERQDAIAAEELLRRDAAPAQRPQADDDEVRPEVAERLRGQLDVVSKGERGVAMDPAVTCLAILGALVVLVAGVAAIVELREHGAHAVTPRAEYRLLQDGLEVARACGSVVSAEHEAFHYAEQYRSEGRVTIERRLRNLLRWGPWVFIAFLSSKPTAARAGKNEGEAQ